MTEERDAIGEVIAEDNARPIHPAVAEYAVAALHTATSDGERVAELELLSKELWRQNEAQAREIERLQNDIAYFPPTVRALTETISQLRDELAALKAQPSGVVLPADWDDRIFARMDELFSNRHEGSPGLECMVVDDTQVGVEFACKQITGMLNACQVSAGGVDEPYMWVRVENEGIEDYTQDKGLAADWMQEQWPVTFPLYRALNAGSAVPDSFLAAARQADDVLTAITRNNAPLATLERTYGKDWGRAIDAIRKDLILQIAAAAPTAKKEG